VVTSETSKKNHKYKLAKWSISIYSHTIFKKPKMSALRIQGKINCNVAFRARHINICMTNISRNQT
jgi:hypothetical protein